MAAEELPILSRGQKGWALGAAILFLIAITFLGFALNTGVARGFAIGWVALAGFWICWRVKIRATVISRILCLKAK